VWSLLLPALAVCQTDRLDTVFLSKAAAHARKVYSLSLGIQSRLYNGVQYHEYNERPDDQGNPYFASDDWVEGTVHYDGEVYYGVAILYDLVHDKVVIEHGVGGAKLQLIDEKLKGFSLSGHRFVQLSSDSLKGTPIRTGYYELVCDGRVKFYFHRRKDQLEVIENYAIHSVFLDVDLFYLFKAGMYYPVKTKREVLNVLADNKTLRKFIRKNKIKFRHHRAQAIKEIVSYYNES
jgi:hypothetical protein